MAVYGSFMIRLRQIALVAHSLDQAIADISGALDLDSRRIRSLVALTDFTFSEVLIVGG